MAVDAVNFNCDESTSLLCKTLKDNRLGKQGVRARQGKCGGADDWWELEWPEGTGEELEWLERAGEEPERTGRTGMTGEELERAGGPGIRAQ